MITRELNEWLTRFGLDVRGIDDREFAGGETFSGDEVKNGKSVFGGCLVVFIVRNESAAGVRREHLGGFEVPPRKRRLPAA